MHGHINHVHSAVMTAQFRQATIKMLKSAKFKLPSMHGDMIRHNYAFQAAVFGLSSVACMHNMVEQHVEHLMSCVCHHAEHVVLCCFVILSVLSIHVSKLL